MSTLFTFCFVLIPTVEISSNKETVIEGEITSMEGIAKVWATIRDIKLLKFWFFTFILGYISAYSFGFLFKVVDTALEDATKQDQKIYLTFVFISLGFCSLLAGFISGKFIDSKPAKYMGAIFCALLIFIMSLTLYALEVKIAWLSLVIGGLIGFTETSIGTLIN